MKYMGMPMGMWVIFNRSFERNLVEVFGLNPNEAKKLTKKAKPRYKEIIAKLPEFEKKDRFKMNIVNCAMLSAFLLNVKEAGNDDSCNAVVLQKERKEKIFCFGYKVYERNGKASGRGQKSVFVEYGFLRICGRKRLRSTVHRLRYLYADDRTGLAE